MLFIQHMEPSGLEEEYALEIFNPLDLHQGDITLGILVELKIIFWIIWVPAFVCWNPSLPFVLNSRAVRWTADWCLLFCVSDLGVGLLILQLQLFFCFLCAKLYFFACQFGAFASCFLCRWGYPWIYHISFMTFCRSFSVGCLLTCGY